MKRIASRIALLLASAVITGVPRADQAPPQGQAGVEKFIFELKCKKGDKHRYRVVLKSDSSQQYPTLEPEPHAVTYQATLVHTEEILAVTPDGGIKVATQYEQLIAGQEGRPLNFAKEELPRLEWIADKAGRRTA